MRKIKVTYKAWTIGDGTVKAMSRTRTFIITQPMKGHVS
jgi:hypothetical protein